MAGWFRSGVVLLLVLQSGLLLGFLDSDASINHPVISEVQALGDGGANDEFIELYNPTDKTIDLSSWSIQVRGGSASTFSKKNFPAGASLSAHGFYLITSSQYNALIAPDLSQSTFNLSSTGATIFLVSNQTTLLTGSEVAIVDKLAYGTGTLFPETSPASAPASEQSLERVRSSQAWGYCVDTDNNSLDFFLQIIPNPQNSSSLAVPCGESTSTPTPSHTPVYTEVFTATPTPTLTSSATASPTATSTATRTPTLLPTASSTATPSFTPSPTPTKTATRTLTPSPTTTSTPTPSFTPTSTAAPTATHSPTSTPKYEPLSLLINEVAWAGSQGSSSDEWIELYNPGPVAINLSGWRLLSSPPELTIEIYLKGSIGVGGYFLLERTDDNSVSNISADQIYTGALSNSGDTLYLYAPSGVLVDSANANGGSWPAGKESPYFSSMERRGVVLDGDNAWLTFNGPPSSALDVAKNPIKGSPRQPNWALSVTLTPAATATKTPTPTITPVIEYVILNEFLARAGSDWNSDGTADVRDEFVEIRNVGKTPVNLKGWKIDHIFGGKSVFSLPNVILPAGGKLTLFGAETKIVLSDGGGTIRLLSPKNIPVDAFSYPLVLFADESWCRMPDGGAWQSACAPTPRRNNSVDARNQLEVGTGNVKLPPTAQTTQSWAMYNHLAELYFAECPGSGLEMLNPHLTP